MKKNFNDLSFKNYKKIMLAIYTNYIINTVKFSDVNKAFIVGQDNTQINFDNTNPTLNDNLIENYIFPIFGSEF